MAARDVIERGVRVVTVLIERQSFGSPRSNEGLVSQLAVSGMATYLVHEGMIWPWPWAPHTRRPSFP